MSPEHLLCNRYPKPFVTGEERYLESLQRFRFGINQLDELIIMYPGSLNLFQGDLPRHLLRQFITKMTVSLLLTNVNTEIAFVDGANIFPYYEISSEARRCNTDPLKILDRIQLARAFNFHQITEILTRQLPKLVVKNPRIRFVIIPQISSLHLSKEASEYLAYDKRPTTNSLLELTTALGTLKQLGLQHDLVGIMTTARAPHSKHKALGGTFLAHAATTIVRMEPSLSGTQDHDLVFILQQDPMKPETEAKITCSEEKENQSVSLLEFW